MSDFNTWGAFEITINTSDFPADYEPGPGKIALWEDSPRDSTRINVVEVPIILPVQTADPMFW